MSEELEDDSAELEQEQQLFDTDLVRKYPKANRKLTLAVERYGIAEEVPEDDDDKNQSQFISPHGIEFRTRENYREGSLLKIHVSLPDYWSRKQKLVDYTRIDHPDTFRILARVVQCEEVGKRGKKRLVTCQTLVIDEVDEQVLKTFLQES